MHVPVRYWHTSTCTKLSSHIHSSYRKSYKICSLVAVGYSQHPLYRETDQRLFHTLWAQFRFGFLLSSNQSKWVCSHTVSVDISAERGSKRYEAFSRHLHPQRLNELFLFEKKLHTFNVLQLLVLDWSVIVSFITSHLLLFFSGLDFDQMGIMTWHFDLILQNAWPEIKHKCIIYKRCCGLICHLLFKCWTWEQQLNMPHFVCIKRCYMAQIPQTFPTKKKKTFVF